MKESIFWATDLAAPFWDGAAAASAALGAAFAGATAAFEGSDGFLSAILRDCCAADYKTEVLLVYAFCVSFFNYIAACFARILY